MDGFELKGNSVSVSVIFKYWEEGGRKNSVKPEYSPNQARNKMAFGHGKGAGTKKYAPKIPGDISS